MADDDAGLEKPTGWPTKNIPEELVAAWNTLPDDQPFTKALTVADINDLLNAFTHLLQAVNLGQTSTMQAFSGKSSDANTSLHRQREHMTAAFDSYYAFLEKIFRSQTEGRA